MTPYRSPVLSLEQISKNDHTSKETLKFSAPPDSRLVTALDFTGGAFVDLAAGVLLEPCLPDRVI